MSYPKFKNGEATVRDVKITQNFGMYKRSVCKQQIMRECQPKLLLCCFADYVEEIYQTFVNASKEALKDAATKLKEKTPAPMNRMLERQPREEAIQN